MHRQFYPFLLKSFPYLSENKNHYRFLTERHIQALWFEQKHLMSLFTSDGELIQVISPGIWNTEAGPDFLKAHLRIGLKEYKGDIEIHLQDEGWYAHGHHLDTRYNQVILHISYSIPRVVRPIIKANTEQVTAVTLEKNLQLSPQQILQCIDLELYPYKRFANSGHCAHTLFNQLEESKIENFFKSAAYWRLEKKAEYLKSRAVGLNAQFMAGIAMALGYKHNAESFLDLLHYLTEFRSLCAKELLAIAMGCTGFFDGRQSRLWEKSPYYQILRDLWWSKKHLITHQSNLRLDQIRPLNHPVRRLVYLTKLLEETTYDTLWDTMLDYWMTHSADLSSVKKCRQLQKSLMRLMPAYADHYWNTHFIFEVAARSKHLSLLGEDVRREILVNAFLPLLYTVLQEKDQPELLEKFKLFYQSFKGVNTSKGRYLEQRFFADRLPRRLLNQAQMEQGAYQLHKDFCLQYEASCDGCPFVQRFLAHSSL